LGTCKPRPYTVRNDKLGLDTEGSQEQNMFLTVYTKSGQRCWIARRGRDGIWLPQTGFGLIVIKFHTLLWTRTGFCTQQGGGNFYIVFRRKTEILYEGRSVIFLGNKRKCQAFLQQAFFSFHFY
jgi:hypothetical protein